LRKPVTGKFIFVYHIRCFATTISVHPSSRILQVLHSILRKPVTGNHAF
jgi:hypothetical protein